MSPPNQPGKLAALAQVIPSEAQVDGVDHHPRTAARLDTFSQAEDKENISPGAMGMPSGSGKGGQQHQQPHHGSPYGNPGFNNSVPVLSNLSAVHMQTRSMTGPHVRRKISFANNLSVHTTWPGNIYDRRGEQATCNRLTPQLAQRIKEELNAFKMEEMEVVSAAWADLPACRSHKNIPANASCLLFVFTASHEPQLYPLLHLRLLSHASALSRCARIHITCPHARFFSASASRNRSNRTTHVHSPLLAHTFCCSVILV